MLDWTYAYRKLLVVDVACELDLFGRLHARPRSAQGLADETGAAPMPLEALLDVCVGLDLLRHDNGLYSNRPNAELYLARLFWGPDREPLPVPRILRWLDDLGSEQVRSFPLTERSTCILAVRGD